MNAMQNVHKNPDVNAVSSREVLRVYGCYQQSAWRPKNSLQYFSDDIHFLKYYDLVFT